jgi:transcriptional regulator with XRE-family HTH domain
MFKQRLKELRKKHGITQEQLAQILGLERSTIGKYEGKKEVIPSAEVLNDIADYFEVSIDYLLGRTDDPYPYENFDEYIPEEFNGDAKKYLAFLKARDEDVQKEKEAKASELVTIAAHTDDPEGIPPEAQEEIFEFIEFVKHKYGIGKKKEK